jgi:hypothetical protein
MKISIKVLIGVGVEQSNKVFWNPDTWIEDLNQGSDKRRSGTRSQIMCSQILTRGWGLQSGLLFPAFASPISNTAVCWRFRYLSSQQQRWRLSRAYIKRWLFLVAFWFQCQAALQHLVEALHSEEVLCPEYRLGFAWGETKAWSFCKPRCRGFQCTRPQRKTPMTWSLFQEGKYLDDCRVRIAIPKNWCKYRIWSLKSF